MPDPHRVTTAHRLGDRLGAGGLAGVDRDAEIAGQRDVERLAMLSRRISISVTFRRLFSSTMRVGSTNTVSPVREVS